jgi:hypothetical protein
VNSWGRRTWLLGVLPLDPVSKVVRSARLARPMLAQGSRGNGRAPVRGGQPPPTTPEFLTWPSVLRAGRRSGFVRRAAFRLRLRRLELHPVRSDFPNLRITSMEPGLSDGGLTLDATYVAVLTTQKGRIVWDCSTAFPHLGTAHPSTSDALSCAKDELTRRGSRDFLEG